MDKMPLNWKIKSKWYSMKQTCQQFGHFIAGRGLTERGHAAYDYLCKVIFDGYKPTTYAETMYEEELKGMMQETKLDRKSAAILMAGTLAKCITPWDFKKKAHKIVSG